jgi:hypothetical protein
MARTNALKTSADTNIIQLKVTLRGVRPPVWRRLLMPGTMALSELHTAIQAVMGWHDCHLHVFISEASRLATGAVSMRLPTKSVRR